MENKFEDNKPVERKADDNQTALSVFGQGSHFSYLYKKTEKLIAAIYMITDFVKDAEPLKWQVRDKALELLSLNIRIVTVSLSERKELLKKYQAISLEIVSLATIAHMGGIISEMNASILKREFEKLDAVITADENKKANEETVVFNNGFFDGRTDVSNGHVSKSSEPARSPANDVLYSQSKEISKGHSPKPAQVQKATETKSDRKTIILKLLGKKSGLSIKDFAESIKDCSEKTIQRELLAMVAAGILKKEGERRWSTYSLAK